MLKGSWKGSSLYTNIVMHFIWVSKVLSEDSPLRLLLHGEGTAILRGLKPATSHSAIKRSTDWASPATIN